MNDKLDETKILKHDEIDATLAMYQGKKKKNVIILSTLHPSFDIENNDKNTLKIVRFYNEI